MEWNESQWLSQFVRAVTAAFPGRVVCIGLQGSRGRGEAAGSRSPSRRKPLSTCISCRTWSQGTIYPAPWSQNTESGELSTSRSH